MRNLSLIVTIILVVFVLPLLPADATVIAFGIVIAGWYWVLRGVKAFTNREYDYKRKPL